MELILLKDVDNLGYKHDKVKVKNGYGRNYLIPFGFGVIANKTNNEKLSKILEKIEAEENANLELYKEMAAKLKGKTLQIPAKAGTSGKIFGSVTNIQISRALNEQLEVDVERKKIEFPDITTLGTYTATIKFHPEVIGEVEFELVVE